MKDQIARLYRRFERVVRYIVVGGGVTLFYSLLTVALVSGRLVNDPTAASAMASLISLPLSFLVHRRFTYADAGSDRSQWQRFVTIAASNFAFTVASMKAVDLLHWPYWIGLVAGWVVIPMLNYTINALWVFRTRTFLALDREQSPPAR
jgi:putative flippase GtrA